MHDWAEHCAQPNDCANQRQQKDTLRRAISLTYHSNAERNRSPKRCREQTTTNPRQHSARHFTRHPVIGTRKIRDTFILRNPPQSMALFSQISRQTHRDLILAGFISLSAYITLFAVFPYSSGYLGGRVSVFETVWNFWQGYDDWKHGMLVPLIAVGLVWMKRGELSTIPIRPSWGGLPVLFLAFFVYWLGYVVDHHYPGFISAQITVAGCIIWFLGWGFMRKLLFPGRFLFSLGRFYSLIR